ncbi:MAG: helix-turn-helix transcriptional regulator [Lachnospiraceae bacterium]|nr:helix-turn-helix transcriptional regulator [Lachnospiraceae bacterium]MBQ6197168.1 helix-turn-helix transcriptional regulator [Lachnospiraceae bacterium]
MPKVTGDLLAELNESTDLTKYLSDNREELVSGEIGSLMENIRQAKKIRKVELARKAGISEFYLYQILKGLRKPSRDMLLAVCLGLGCTEEQTEKLLKSGGYSPLYVRFKRDSVILYGIIHGCDALKVNDMLYEQGESPLGNA